MLELNPDKAYKLRLLKAKNGKIIALGAYTKLDTEIKFQCNVCFNTFKMTPRLLAKTKQVCKHCATPKVRFTIGQRMLAHYLQSEFNFTDKQLLTMFEIKKPNLGKLIKKTDGELPEKNGIVVLGLDPATTNFGVSVIKIFVRKDGSLKSAVCLESRLLINTFTTLNNLDYNTKLDRLIDELRSLVKNWQPDIMIMERYQSRGGFSSSSNELVNIMLGNILREFRNSQAVPLIRIVPPSGWKKRVSVIFDLKAEYKRIARLLLPHLLDASLISLSVFPEAKNPFYWLRKPKKRNKFINSIYNACWQLDTITKIDKGSKTPYNYTIPF